LTKKGESLPFLNRDPEKTIFLFLAEITAREFHLDVTMKPENRVRERGRKEMTPVPIHSTFVPPFGLRGPHLQTILSSLKIRARAEKQLDRDAREILVDAGEGVRLLGFFTGQRPGSSRGLILLLHGWEGGSDSTYMMTTGGFLYRKGYDIFRLNLRDHGDSHHLNEGLFNSSLIEETHRAVQNIADTGGNPSLSIVGFSLGGNFAMRMALRHSRYPIRNLHRVFAVSPVLDPRKATDAMDRGLFVYRSYFVKKWKQSLRKKQSLFPGRYDFDDLMGCQTLMEITDRILPRYSPYPTAQEYFETYTLTGRRFSELSVPLLVLTAADDPIIPVEDFLQLEGNHRLRVHVEQHGGHCGFLRNYRLQSWVPEFIHHTLLPSG
jgi:predicted alpha/beta-fold hydrolase